MTCWNIFLEILLNAWGIGEEQANSQAHIMDIGRVWILYPPVLHTGGTCHLHLQRSLSSYFTFQCGGLKNISYQILIKLSREKCLPFTAPPSCFPHQLYHTTKAVIYTSWRSTWWSKWGMMPAAGVILSHLSHFKFGRTSAAEVQFSVLVWCSLGALLWTNWRAGAVINQADPKDRWFYSVKDVSLHFKTTKEKQCYSYLITMHSLCITHRHVAKRKTKENSRDAGKWCKILH